MISIDENLWYGPYLEDIMEFEAQGFDLIVSLETDYNNIVMNSYEEYGLEMRNILCNRFHAPNRDQVMIVMMLILSRKKKTYLHCPEGIDRTAFMVAVYRMIEQGWSFKHAHAEFVSMGRHWSRAWWAVELARWSSR